MLQLLSLFHQRRRYSNKVCSCSFCASIFNAFSSPRDRRLLSLGLPFIFIVPPNDEINVYWIHKSWLLSGEREEALLLPRPVSPRGRRELFPFCLRSGAERELTKKAGRRGRGKGETRGGPLGGEGNDDRWREGEGCLECPPFFHTWPREKKYIRV